MKKILSILTVTLVSVFAYREWFTFKLFSYGDYVYYLRDSLLEHYPFSVWGSQIDLGNFDLLFWRLPQYVQYYLGAKAGFDFNQIDRLVVMWPWVFLSTFSIYLLLDLRIKSEKAKIAGALLFACNTYFLSISTQGHLLISIASCLGVITLSLYIRFLENSRMIMALIVAVMLSLVTIYDLRIWYIISAVIGVYSLFYAWTHIKKRKIFLPVFFKFFLVYFIYFPLNIYWILPMVGSGGAGQEILGRLLFGNEFLNVLYSYSLFHPFWTGSQPAWFLVQPISLYAWILPILALTGYLVTRKSKFFSFFGLLAIIGIFFTKQVSIPFTEVYEWFYLNVPGFNAFREASKFYFLIAMSYAVLIAGFLDYLNSSKKVLLRCLNWFVFVLVLSVIFFNLKALFTGEIGSLFVERKISEEYREFNELVKEQNEYFRVAWFPRAPWWRNGTVNHPQLSVMDLLGTDWRQFRSKEAYKLYEDGKIKAADVGLIFLSSQSANLLLDSASVKYLVLPISEPDRQDDVYLFFGKNSKEIYEEVKKIPYLREVSSFSSELKIFENTQFMPHFYISSLHGFTEINNRDVSIEVIRNSTTSYDLRLRTNDQLFDVIFSEKYAPGWILELNNYANTQDSKSDQTRLGSEKNNAGLNSFRIDPKLLCKPQGACKRSSEGMYEYSLKLKYKPQTLFYLGLGISVFTLVILMVVVIKTLIEQKNKYGKK